MRLSFLLPVIAAQMVLGQASGPDITPSSVAATSTPMMSLPVTDSLGPIVTSTPGSSAGGALSSIFSSVKSAGSSALASLSSEASSVRSSLASEASSVAASLSSRASSAAAATSTTSSAFAAATQVPLAAAGVVGLVGAVIML